MTPPRILVVDDNQLNLKLAADVLANDGYDVSKALNAEIALERIREQAPDLILMDIQLPGMDGLALTHMLKADSTTRAIPVIALTAFAMKGDEQRARDAGCEGYLTKPINTRTLSAQVAGFLRAGSRRTSMKILVVEDVPSDLKLARVILTSAGYEVAEANTGEKALAAVRDDPPDLILMDLKLPDVNGLALIRQIRQNAATRNISVLAITSYPRDWSEERARDAGCTAYFPKPVDANALLKQIDLIVSNSGSKSGGSAATAKQD